MKGVKAEWKSGSELPRRLQGTETYLVTKTRGKLTLDEIEEALKAKGLEGWFCIVLRVADEDTYTGWELEEPKGDMVYVSFIDEACDCPVCRQLTPFIGYCPECGHRIDTIGGE
jgi:hypothetical protein